MAPAVFKTVATLLRRVRWVRFPHALATLATTTATVSAPAAWPALGAIAAVTAAVLSCPSKAAAQRTGTPARPPAPTRDTIPGAPRVVAPIVAVDTVSDSLSRPPISPRRALVLSLVLPGYAQSRLRRPAAAVLFAATEVLFVGLARQAALDLREAKAARRDSVPTTFTVDANTGVVTPAAFVRSPLAARLGARRTHYEDWIAAIIFNHIIAGADAYVAANLWDFHANVSLDPVRHSAALGGSVPF